MPHKHPNVRRERITSKYVARVHEMPHEHGLTELPDVHNLPTPLNRIPRIGPRVLSFGKR